MKKTVAIALAVAWMFIAQTQAQAQWIVGQSAPLTGGNAAFGKDIRDGALAYFKSVNARGGVNGRQIDLITIDDRNERKQAGENAQILLRDKKAVALFGFASATLSLDAMPLAEQNNVLFFAPFSGADPVRKASPVVFTLRASYGQELESMLSFWTGFGVKKVVVVHYDDEVGKQNFAVVTDFLSKLNQKPSSISIKRNAKIDPAVIESLVSARPEVMINTVLSGPAAEISKQLTERGMVILTSSLSFVGAQQYITAAGPAASGVSIAQVVPNPAGSAAIVRECAKALQDAGVTATLNSTHLEACIGAKVLTEAMRQAKKPGNSESLLEAMSNLGTYDVGGFVVKYAPNKHHGSSYVSLGMVSRDGRMRN